MSGSQFALVLDGEPDITGRPDIYSGLSVQY